MNTLPGKLGKHPLKRRLGTPLASRYMRALPPPPQVIDWTGKMTFPCGMALNDSLGDCTCAAIAHAIQLTTSQAGTEITIPDASVLTVYEMVSGYNPVTGVGADAGAECVQVLNWWKNAGILRPDGFTFDKLAAYAEINPRNSVEMMQGLDLFGFLYIGVDLPESIQSQMAPGVWDVPTPAQNVSLGGHCVIVVGRKANGNWLIITWGALQEVTDAFMQTRCDEAYIALTLDWIEADGMAPSGFATAALQADMADMAEIAP